MSSKLGIIGRAIGSVGAVVALAGGITYAALTSNTATLSQSTISTGTASLKIYNFPDGQWETSAPGFQITKLVPGTGVDEHFYLQNDGDSSLDVTATVPTLPGPPSGGDYGFSGFQNVKVDITGEKCGDTVNTNLAALNAGKVALPCNPLTAGAAGNSNVTGTEGNYKIHFDINPDVVTGGSAGVGPFDIVFQGTASAPVNNT
jgi:hypothetical protein